MNYNLGVVREMLAAALNDDAIGNLAFDILPDFYFNHLGTHHTPSQKIKALLEHAARQGQIEAVVAYVERANPYQYNRFADRLFAVEEAPTPNKELVQQDSGYAPERLATVREHIQTHLTLLEQYERELETAVDARLRLGIERNIERERASLSKYQQEAASLSQLVQDENAATPQQQQNVNTAYQQAFQAVRHELIGLVLRLSVVGSFNGRSSLLYGIPDSDMLSRDEDIMRLDIDLITQQLAAQGKPENTPAPLIEFIRNARGYASGEIDEQLNAIQQTLEAA